MKHLLKLSLKQFIIILLFLGFSCQKTDTPDTYAVKINESYLSDKSLLEQKHEYGDDSIDKYVLIESWIETELLYQEALKIHLDKDPVLAEKLEKYKKELLASNYVNYYFSDKIQVSDEEILKFYNVNKSSFRIQKKSAKIVHYLFTDSDEAKSTKRILLYGDSSKRNSIKERYMPEEKIVSEGELIEKLNEELFHKNSNRKVIGPISTTFGFHVLFVKEYYKVGSYFPVAEVRQTISNRIGSGKRNLEYVNLIKSLRKKSDVEFQK